MVVRKLSRSLGWASLGIGLSELTAPDSIRQSMGVGKKSRGILRVLGARELLHGFDILSHRNPAPGVRSRLAGDLLDGVLLGVAATKTRKPGSFATIAAMVMGIVVLDVVFSRLLSHT